MKLIFQNKEGSTCLLSKGLADIGINKALIEIFVGKTTKRRTWNARNAE